MRMAVKQVETCLREIFALARECQILYHRGSRLRREPGRGMARSVSMWSVQSRWGIIVRRRRRSCRVRPRSLRALRAWLSTQLPGAVRNARAGSTNRRAGAACSWASAREPCSPRPRVDGAVESAMPSCSEIQLRIAAELAPSARITERSITIPPEACGRAKRLTRAAVSSVAIGVISVSSLSQLGVADALELAVSICDAGLQVQQGGEQL